MAEPINAVVLVIVLFKNIFGSVKIYLIGGIEARIIDAIDIIIGTFIVFLHLSFHVIYS